MKFQKIIKYYNYEAIFKINFMDEIIVTDYFHNLIYISDGK